MKGRGKGLVIKKSHANNRLGCLADFIWLLYHCIYSHPTRISRGLVR